MKQDKTQSILRQISVTMTNPLVPKSEKKGWPWDSEILPFPREKQTDSLLPKVTIVTPSYNQGNFLEEAIRSVLLQNYDNVEYIIIDGGSTDNSCEVIQKYSQWITYWISEPDDGQASAINKGWSLATGEFITWLNSDDILLPGSLHVTVDRLIKYPQTGIVYGDVIVRHEGSKSGDRCYILKGEPFKIEEVKRNWHNPIPQPGFLMRKEVLDIVGDLDEAMHFAFDLDYWIRAALNNIEMCYLPMTLAQFRVHSQSKTHKSKFIRIDDSYRILGKITKQGRARGYISILLDFRYYSSSMVDIMRCDKREPYASIMTSKRVMSLLIRDHLNGTIIMAVVLLSVACGKLWIKTSEYIGIITIRIK
ncbi:MAG: glycosyltransferase family 2 protein [Thermodesulfobacteriota bacterium]